MIGHQGNGILITNKWGDSEVLWSLSSHLTHLLEHRTISADRI